ncbi:hypothetical protein COV93_07140, partial [Candidatus Woesearchaeota archaeon CG11_big_fil_rev_8_21_14_0_20_43_8]
MRYIALMIIGTIIGILSTSFVDAIQINEIMHNPEGNDNNKEFIEILLDVAISLNGSIIMDASSNDTLVVKKYTNSSYALIVEEGFDYSGLDCSIYSAGATIGNGLTKGEMISLLFNGTVISADIPAYGDGNGMSAEYSETWMESEVYGGTPCNQNSVMQEDNTTGSGKEDEREEDCDIFLKVTTDKTIYEGDEQVQIHNDVTGDIEDWSIEYWIEDIYGDIVKQKKNTTNENTKVWSPKVSGMAYIAKGILHSGCGTANAESLFAVRGEVGENEEENIEMPDNESRIQIVETTYGTYPPRFGDILYVEAEIYKGDTRKTVIEAYIHDDEKTISEKTKIYVDNKYETIKSRLPLMIKPDCDGKMQDGSYTITIKGLDAEAETSITVEGISEDSCKEVIKKVNITQKKQSPPKIESFYSRKKIFDVGDNITINAKVKTSTQATAYLCLGQMEIETEGDETLTFETTVPYDRTRYLLAMIDQEGMGIIEKLYINATEDGKDEKETCICEQTDCEQAVSIETKSKTVPIITGDVVADIVYESDDQKTKKYIPYLILTLSAILNIGLI